MRFPEMISRVNELNILFQNLNKLNQQNDIYETKPICRS